jgi:hypothetical protein
VFGEQLIGKSENVSKLSNVLAFKTITAIHRSITIIIAILHHHSYTVTALTRNYRLIGGQTPLKRFCPIRGATFFSTCASIVEKGLPGCKKILRDSPVLA